MRLSQPNSPLNFMATIHDPLIFPIIVAAGVGKRFGSELPKQYTKIHNKTVLEHSVAALTQITDLQPLRVVISAEDNFAKSIKFILPIEWVIGGAERMHSVFNGAQAVWQNCEVNNRQDAWVLIHDAARPCVKPSDIKTLIDQVTHSEQGKTAGGILAVPVRDTVKKSKKVEGEILSQTTIDRSTLWLAQTPQLFPLEPLYHFLQQAIAQNIPFTDEASLFEHFGKMPLLIEGSHSNIKLTFPEDMLFAEVFLA